MDRLAFWEKAEGMFENKETIKVGKDQLSQWKVMIAIPCYDQLMTESCMMSLVDATVLHTRAGLQFSVMTMSDSLISRARNILAARFMSLKDYTHLMFIDADLGFPKEALVKMLWHDKDIVTGSYPVKEINWEKVAEAAKAGTEPSKLLEKSLRYVVNPVQTGQTELEYDKGAISVYDAGTGFMLIKRSVFEKLFALHPELKFTDDTGTLKGDENNYAYALFNSFVESGRFLSEDYGFCRYWQAAGGRIWTDPSIALTHVGRSKYHGT
ncbi:MAG: hypothetical protein EBW15_07770, partial [Actinobacteria bacterium]|nr:hypothetical protein [Actinomycetota bacterium]